MADRWFLSTVVSVSAALPWGLRGLQSGATSWNRYGETTTRRAEYDFTLRHSAPCCSGTTMLAQQKA